MVGNTSKVNYSDYLLCIVHRSIKIGRLNKWDDLDFIARFHKSKKTSICIRNSLTRSNHCYPQ